MYAPDGMLRASRRTPSPRRPTPPRAAARRCVRAYPRRAGAATARATTARPSQCLAPARRSASHGGCPLVPRAGAHAGDCWPRRGVAQHGCAQHVPAGGACGPLRARAAAAEEAARLGMAIAARQRRGSRCMLSLRTCVALAARRLTRRPRAACLLCAQRDTDERIEARAVEVDARRGAGSPTVCAPAPLRVRSARVCASAPRLPPAAAPHGGASCAAALASRFPRLWRRCCAATLRLGAPPRRLRVLHAPLQPSQRTALRARSASAGRRVPALQSRCAKLRAARARADRSAAPRLLASALHHGTQRSYADIVRLLAGQVRRHSGLLRAQALHGTLRLRRGPNVLRLRALRVARCALHAARCVRAAQLARCRRCNAARSGAVQAVRNRLMTRLRHARTFVGAVQGGNNNNPAADPVEEACARCCCARRRTRTSCACPPAPPIIFTPACLLPRSALHALLAASAPLGTVHGSASSAARSGAVRVLARARCCDGVPPRTCRSCGAACLCSWRAPRPPWMLQPPLRRRFGRASTRAPLPA